MDSVAHSTSVEPSRFRPLIAVIGLVLGLLTLLSMLTVMTQVGKPTPVVAGPTIEKLEQVRSANQQSLNSFGWVDKGKGVVRIPIDAAMEKVIVEQRK